MNKERAAQIWPVMRAYAGGAKIQSRENRRPDPWSDLEVPWSDLEVPSFGCKGLDYRIKPEPVWRPWKPSEVPTYFMVKSIGFPYKYLAERLIFGEEFVCRVDGVPFRPEQLFESYARLNEDGTTSPCGVLETEP